MPENYILLERTELNASAASVTFASIPQTGYTDLKIVISGRSDSSDDQIWISLNGSTTGFSNRVLFGSGSSAASTSVARFAAYQTPGTGTTANTFGNSEIYIPNYTSSNFKSMSGDTVWEQNATTAYTALNASLWSNTAAITSVTLTPQTGNFVANSTFSLYGIAAVGTTPAIAPKASGGNIIDFDGTYWIHTFTSSGTFTPQTGLTCDYLVLAGGGGGTYGGGGAGGLRSTVTATGGGGSLESPISVLSGTPYAITVGAGGVAGTNTVVGSSTNGGNSTFSTITSTGGGRGGVFGNPGQPGNSGGSGGGGGGADSASTAGAGGAASPSGQGFAGGSGSVLSTLNGGGGGGGAGVLGSNAGTNTFGGQGGNGVATVISGTSVTRGGGGSGGGSISSPGGTGGGGAGGASNSVGTAAVANTGGGGGGGGNTTGGLSGGAGGSGIVIIRYPAA